MFVDSKWWKFDTREKYIVFICLLFIFSIAVVFQFISLLFILLFDKNIRIWYDKCDQQIVQHASSSSQFSYMDIRGRRLLRILRRDKH